MSNQYARSSSTPAYGSNYANLYAKVTSTTLGADVEEVAYFGGLDLRVRTIDESILSQDGAGTFTINQGGRFSVIANAWITGDNSGKRELYMKIGASPTKHFGVSVSNNDGDATHPQGIQLCATWVFEKGTTFRLYTRANTAGSIQLLGSDVSATTPSSLMIIFHG